MRTFTRLLAAMHLVLVFPAVLFMTALFLRSIQPLQYQPAHISQQLVDWYAARPHIALWGLLITLPFVVLVTGSGMLIARWKSEPELRNEVRHVLAQLRTHLATVLTAGATAVAGGILVIVALHVLTD